jgi:diguanylate cyclase (GGDEF)-like protein
VFAAALKDSLREYDYAARIGGDEFVIVAPGLAPEAVMEISERLQMAASSVGSAVCGRTGLSVSIGKASYPTDGEDAETLLSAADHSMYQMKRSRRASAEEQVVS